MLDSLDLEGGGSGPGNNLLSAATATCVVGGIEAANKLGTLCSDAKIDNN
uniref:Uncharacterized protein n=1 Tax=Megaselia scalaris TaxID=36166 RepID=T1GHI3_MEGSC